MKKKKLRRLLTDVIVGIPSKEHYVKFDFDVGDPICVPLMLPSAHLRNLSGLCPMKSVEIIEIKTEKVVFHLRQEKTLTVGDKYDISFPLGVKI